MLGNGVHPGSHSLDFSLSDIKVECDSGKKFGAFLIIKLLSFSDIAAAGEQMCRDRGNDARSVDA
jgi:hypothetical protein